MNMSLTSLELSSWWICLFLFYFALTVKQNYLLKRLNTPFFVFLYLAEPGWWAGRSPEQWGTFCGNQPEPLRAANTEDSSQDDEPGGHPAAVNVPTRAGVSLFTHGYKVSSIVAFFGEETVHVCSQLILSDTNTFVWWRGSPQNSLINDRDKGNLVCKHKKSLVKGNGCRMNQLSY